MELFTQKKDGNPNNKGQPAQPAGNNQSKGVGLLGGGKAIAAVGPSINQETAQEITTLSRKIRINEERAMNIRKKTQMIEHNILSNHKKILTEMRYINEEISDIKKEIVGIKSKLSAFAHELSEAAKKDDVNVLERYINIWEPVNFVTRKEVERIISDILEEKGIIKDPSDK